MGMGAGYPFPPPLYQAQYAAVYANQVQQWYYNYYRLVGGACGVCVGRRGGATSGNRVGWTPHRGTYRST